MRNSGGSTDNNGHTTQKYGPNQSQKGASWPSPASGFGPAPRLRSTDVIDAEFVHVDDDGNALPSRGLAPSPRDQSARPAQVDFEDERSARYRRLSLFSGGALPSGSGRKFPTLGFAILVAAVSLGGFWLAGGHVIASMLAGTQTSSSSVLPDAVSNSVVGGDAVIVRGKVGNQPQSVLSVPSAANGPTGQRTEGSLIYVRARKKQPVAGESKGFRVPVSPPVRSHKDLTISLAGGSDGR